MCVSSVHLSVRVFVSLSVCVCVCVCVCERERERERRLPKAVLYCQLLDAPRKAGDQKLRFKDTLRHNLQNVDIDHKIGK